VARAITAATVSWSPAASRRAKDRLGLLLADPKDLSGDAADMFRRLPTPPMTARTEAELEQAAVQTVFASDLLVDAIVGTGFRPPLSGLAARAIELMREAAVEPDTEFGRGKARDFDGHSIWADSDGEAIKNASSSAPSSAVVTFTAPRRVHVCANLSSGPTVVTKIGSPAEAIQSSLGLHAITAADIETVVVPVDRTRTKEHSVMCSCGGSLGKSGAAAMAGIAALRSGAGLVTIATPRPSSFRSLGLLRN